MTRLDLMRRAIDERTRTGRQLRDELHAIAGTSCSRAALDGYRAEHSTAIEHMELLCIPALCDLIACAEQLRAILRDLEAEPTRCGRGVSVDPDNVHRCDLAAAIDALARLESGR